MQNERDRKVLAWPRGRVGDAAIAGAAQVCTLSDSKLYLSVIRRQLGLSVPKAHESLREYGCSGGATLGGDLRDLALAFI